MAPVAWLMGIPWQEAVPAGSLLGIKTVLNEFLAYMELAKLPEQTLSPRSTVILTYALCGFVNFGSLGIMIGGIGTMAPERKNEIIALGIRSIHCWHPGYLFDRCNSGNLTWRVGIFSSKAFFYPRKILAIIPKK